MSLCPESFHFVPSLPFPSGVPSLTLRPGEHTLPASGTGPLTEPPLLSVPDRGVTLRAKDKSRAAPGKMTLSLHQAGIEPRASAVGGVALPELQSCPARRKLLGCCTGPGAIWELSGLGRRVAASDTCDTIHLPLSRVLCSVLSGKGPPALGLPRSAQGAAP